MSSIVNAEQTSATDESAINTNVDENDADIDASESISTTTGNTGVSSTTPEIKTQDICIAEGCNNAAIQHPEWDNEYCSVSCTYKHCKATFIAWLENNKTAKAKPVSVLVFQENSVVKQENEELETCSTTS
ncbi:TOX high mobility group box family member 4-like [Melanaphis sacchari]|uniref:TOX high mobility group box family member 4-like n=1 Tax=Melanaphis sacchari TaxID=742174 RepID=UPI000DC147C7|nr:TOX high mobility group box family member 4-like [Melanaphis sacchari]